MMTTVSYKIKEEARLQKAELIKNKTLLQKDKYRLERLLRFKETLKS